MHHRAKFRLNRSIHCRDIAIFQHGGRSPSWICLGQIWTAHESYLVVSITEQSYRQTTLQNLVTIDALILITWKFQYMAYLT